MFVLNNEKKYINRKAAPWVSKEIWTISSLSSFSRWWRQP